MTSLGSKMIIENTTATEQNFETNIQNTISNDAYTKKGAVGVFKSEFEKLLSNFSKEKVLNKDDEINKLFLDLDFGAQYDIESTKIGQADAMFFINMLNQNGLINYQVEDDGLQVTTKNDQQMQVSKSLISMLQTSYDTKKPIRMDFDNNVTVILKLDDKGKVNAHFIPGDKAVEEYLKNNIPYLRQRFDEQNISYSNISYRQHKDQNQKNKKENNQ